MAQKSRVSHKRSCNNIDLRQSSITVTNMTSLVPSPRIKTSMLGTQLRNSRVNLQGGESVSPSRYRISDSSKPSETIVVDIVPSGSFETAPVMTSSTDPANNAESTRGLAAKTESFLKLKPIITPIVKPATEESKTAEKEKPAKDEEPKETPTVAKTTTQESKPTSKCEPVKPSTPSEKIKDQSVNSTKVVSKPKEEEPNTTIPKIFDSTVESNVFEVTQPTRGMPEPERSYLPSEWKPGMTPAMKPFTLNEKSNPIEKSTQDEQPEKDVVSIRSSRKSVKEIEELLKKILGAESKLNTETKTENKQKSVEQALRDYLTKSNSNLQLVPISTTVKIEESRPKAIESIGDLLKLYMQKDTKLEIVPTGKEDSTTRKIQNIDDLLKGYLRTESKLEFVITSARGNKIEPIVEPAKPENEKSKDVPEEAVSKFLSPKPTVQSEQKSCERKSDEKTNEPPLPAPSTDRKETQPVVKGKKMKADDDDEEESAEDEEVRKKPEPDDSPFEKYPKNQVEEDDDDDEEENELIPCSVNKVNLAETVSPKDDGAKNLSLSAEKSKQSKEENVSAGPAKPEPGPVESWHQSNYDTDNSKLIQEIEAMHSRKKNGTKLNQTRDSSRRVKSWLPWEWKRRMTSMKPPTPEEKVKQSSGEKMVDTTATKDDTGSKGEETKLEPTRDTIDPVKSEWKPEMTPAMNSFTTTQESKQATADNSPKDNQKSSSQGAKTANAFAKKLIAPILKAFGIGKESDDEPKEKDSKTSDSIDSKPELDALNESIQSKKTKLDTDVMKTQVKTDLPVELKPGMTPAVQPDIQSEDSKPKKSDPIEKGDNLKELQEISKDNHPNSQGKDGETSKQPLPLPTTTSAPSPQESIPQTKSEKASSDQTAEQESKPTQEVSKDKPKKVQPSKEDKEKIIDNGKDEDEDEYEDAEEVQKEELNTSKQSTAVSNTESKPVEPEKLTGSEATKETPMIVIRGPVPATGKESNAESKPASTQGTSTEDKPKKMDSSKDDTKKPSDPNDGTDEEEEYEDEEEETSKQSTQPVSSSDKQTSPVESKPTASSADKPNSKPTEDVSEPVKSNLPSEGRPDEKAQTSKFETTYSSASTSQERTPVSFTSAELTPISFPNDLIRQDDSKGDPRNCEKHATKESTLVEDSQIDPPKASDTPKDASSDEPKPADVSKSQKDISINNSEDFVSLTTNTPIHTVNMSTLTNPQDESSIKTDKLFNLDKTKDDSTTKEAKDDSFSKDSKSETSKDELAAATKVNTPTQDAPKDEQKSTKIDPSKDDSKALVDDKDEDEEESEEEEEEKSKESSKNETSAKESKLIPVELFEEKTEKDEGVSKQPKKIDPSKDDSKASEEEEEEEDDSEEEEKSKDAPESEKTPTLRTKSETSSSSDPSTKDSKNLTKQSTPEYPSKDEPIQNKEVKEHDDEEDLEEEEEKPKAPPKGDQEKKPIDAQESEKPMKSDQKDDLKAKRYPAKILDENPESKFSMVLVDDFHLPKSGPEENECNEVEKKPKKVHSKEKQSISALKPPPDSPTSIAKLNGKKDETLKTSFEEPLEPDSTTRSKSIASIVDESKPVSDKQVNTTTQQVSKDHSKSPVKDKTKQNFLNLLEKSLSPIMINPPVSADDSEEKTSVDQRKDEDLESPPMVSCDKHNVTYITGKKGIDKKPKPHEDDCKPDDSKPIEFSLYPEHFQPPMTSTPQPEQQPKRKSLTSADYLKNFPCNKGHVTYTKPKQGSEGANNSDSRVIIEYQEAMRALREEKRFFLDTPKMMDLKKEKDRIEEERKNKQLLSTKPIIPTTSVPEFRPPDDSTNSKLMTTTNKDKDKTSKQVNENYSRWISVTEDEPPKDQTKVSGSSCAKHANEVAPEKLTGVSKENRMIMIRGPVQTTAKNAESKHASTQDAYNDKPKKLDSSKDDAKPSKEEDEEKKLKQSTQPATLSDKQTTQVESKPTASSADKSSDNVSEPVKSYLPSEWKPGMTPTMIPLTLLDETKPVENIQTSKDSKQNAGPLDEGTSKQSIPTSKDTSATSKHLPAVEKIGEKDSSKATTEVQQPVQEVYKGEQSKKIGPSKDVAKTSDDSEEEEEYEDEEEEKPKGSVEEFKLIPARLFEEKTPKYVFEQPKKPDPPKVDAKTSDTNDEYEEYDEEEEEMPKGSAKSGTSKQSDTEAKPAEKDGPTCPKHSPTTDQTLTNSRYETTGNINRTPCPKHSLSATEDSKSEKLVTVTKEAMKSWLPSERKQGLSPAMLDESKPAEKKQTCKDATICSKHSIPFNLAKEEMDNNSTKDKTGDATFSDSIEQARTAEPCARHSRQLELPKVDLNTTIESKDGFKLDDSMDETSLQASIQPKSDQPKADANQKASPVKKQKQSTKPNCSILRSNRIIKSTSLYIDIPCEQAKDKQKPSTSAEDDGKEPIKQSSPSKKDNSEDQKRPEFKDEDVVIKRREPNEPTQLAITQFLPEHLPKSCEQIAAKKEDKITKSTIVISRGKKRKKTFGKLSSQVRISVTTHSSVSVKPIEDSRKDFTVDRFLKSKLTDFSLEYLVYKCSKSSRSMGSPIGLIMGVIMGTIESKQEFFPRRDEHFLRVLLLDPSDTSQMKHRKEVLEYPNLIEIIIPDDVVCNLYADIYGGYIISGHSRLTLNSLSLERLKKDDNQYQTEKRHTSGQYVTEEDSSQVSVVYSNESVSYYHH